MTRTMLSVCLSVSLSACAVTQQAPLKASAGGSGLVDYSMLKPGAPGQADLRYITMSSCGRFRLEVVDLGARSSDPNPRENRNARDR